MDFAFFLDFNDYINGITLLSQAALHVWKTIVANTPKTLKEIMPVLMNTLISSLASSSSERRQVLCFSLSFFVSFLAFYLSAVIPPLFSAVQTLPFISNGKP